MAKHLSTILQKELDMQIDEEHFWTDSKIVLAYLANEQKRFHVYVANRVHQIKTATDVGQWHHISGSENPADIASRGMNSSKLQESMWFTGPEFLKQWDLRERLSTQDINKGIDANDPEVKRLKETKATKLNQEQDL
ncbi:uncharacterized protein [Watersipora subatra]|uniref:uncharacterized protein n=1 Tax=Watersipora subatra TaxID=2589382 RepID=UPI00355B709C